MPGEAHARGRGAGVVKAEPRGRWAPRDEAGAGRPGPRAFPGGAASPAPRLPGIAGSGRVRT
jgi:hypothetical protein